MAMSCDSLLIEGRQGQGQGQGRERAGRAGAVFGCPKTSGENLFLKDLEYSRIHSRLR